MTVCRHHGGSTPQVKRKARQRVVLGEIVKREPTDEERRNPLKAIKRALVALEAKLESGELEPRDQIELLVT